MRRFSGRGLLIAIGLIFFFVIVFGRAIAGFYVDYLWHDSLGRFDIFWGQIWAKATLFVVFFVAFALVAGLNLFLADRAAPTSFPANVHPYVERFHEIFGHRLRLVRYGTALVLAFMLALPSTAKWQDWLLFRNSKSFGVEDAQFSADVGFYVFELPFISYTIDWLFAAMIIVLLLTLAAHLLNGGVVFTSSAPTVRPTTKAHIAVLLAVIAAIKAADYWITRYELTNERRGFVQGATYTVVKAQLPALMLLVLVALLTAVLYLTTIRTNRWRLPLVASGLWLVILIGGGLIYPALVQSLLVRPNQAEREAPYIARNVEATRAAMGIDDVTTESVDFGRLNASEVEGDLKPIENVRLLNPTQMKSRFEFDRGETAGLTIDDLDVDRYEIDGERQQVLIAARELDLNNIPNTSWQGEHIISTRGCGLVRAPVSQVTTSDRPDYETLNLDRPELYFSPAISGYAVARTDASEFPCGDGTPYAGTDGVEMKGFARRAAFALAFLDYNIIGTGSINADSQMLFVRDVRDRVDKLAPFLSYDGDPYPVVVEGGVQWVIDGYTSTSRYPYAQRVGSVQLTERTGIPSGANYIRNSVKAVVDAYTGSVTFYVMDPEDPILSAWQSAFPDLFTPLDQMPGDLIEHLRYPEDLFRVQTELYSKYQISAEDFFQREGAWSVAQAPLEGPRDTNNTVTSGVDPDAVSTDFATESNRRRFVPYYTLFRNRLTNEFEFVILRPFVPFSPDDNRTELQAYMTASSDPDSYGTLISYEVDAATLPSGPLRVVSQAESEQEISREITFQDNEESKSFVRFGDLQLVPVADGLVWVRPFYVEIDNVTEYRYVIVSHNNDATFARDLGTALAGIFPGFDAELGDRVRGVEDDGAGQDSDADSGETDEPTDTTEPDESEPAEPIDDNSSAAELLAEADRLFIEADQQLRSGDLGGYQATVDRASDLVGRALELIENG